MFLTHSDCIISHTVLNPASGELESMDFKFIPQKKLTRGGFSLMYKSYDTVVTEVITSKLDYQIILYIRDLFTYARIENHISPTDIAKFFKCSKPKVVRLISQLVEHSFLFKVDRGVYRLNPFMYVPYKGNAAELQAEWSELTYTFPQEVVH